MLKVFGWLLFGLGATLVVVFGWIGVDTGTPLGSVTNIAGLNSGGYLMISGAIIGSAAHILEAIQDSKHIKPKAKGASEEGLLSKPFERKFSADGICAGCGKKLTAFTHSGDGLCTDCAFEEFTERNT